MQESQTESVRHGVMLKPVHLLGTSLTLEISQHVSLTPASNQPNTSQWFAQPADGQWADGIDHNPDDSILIDPKDVRLIDPKAQHTPGTIFSRLDRNGRRVVQLADGYQIHIGDENQDIGTIDANADRIVLTWNSHDDLLNVLDRILTEVDENYANGFPLPSWDSQARTAFANAKHVQGGN